MKYPKDYVNKVICGDCLDTLQGIPDESIQMCMTSPPYWGLRDYGTTQIIGGDPDCKHKWSTYTQKPKGGPAGKTADVSANKNAFANMRDHDVVSNTCLKCGAWKGQLGLEPTPELYIEHMTTVFHEVKRTLRKDGTLWLNIGDTYGGSCQGGGDTGLSKQRHRKELLTYIDKPQKKMMPKCLMMIPERLAWSLIQDGWTLRNKICWHKSNSMPSSVKDRFSNTWEYVYFFSKSNDPVYWTNSKTKQTVRKMPPGTKGIEGTDWQWQEVGRTEGGAFNVRVKDADKNKYFQKATKKEKENYGKPRLKKMSLWAAHDYYFDLDAVREPLKESSVERLFRGVSKENKYSGELYGGKQPRHSMKKPRDRIPRKLRPGKKEKEYLEQSMIPGVSHKLISPGLIALQKNMLAGIGKNPGDYWPISTQSFSEAHFSVFPEKLCGRPIKAGCPEGRIVLDPFCGAGTALYVAKEMRRRFIGVDIKQEYVDMANRKLRQGIL